MAGPQVLTVQLPAFHHVSKLHDLVMGALKDSLTDCRIIYKGKEVSSLFKISFETLLLYPYQIMLYFVCVCVWWGRLGDGVASVCVCAWWGGGGGVILLDILLWKYYVINVHYNIHSL